MGIRSVRGRSRIPKPPARITACIDLAFESAGDCRTATNHEARLYACSGKKHARFTEFIGSNTEVDRKLTRNTREGKRRREPVFGGGTARRRRARPTLDPLRRGLDNFAESAATTPGDDGKSLTY